jgi:hypothetical protein
LSELSELSKLLIFYERLYVLRLTHHVYPFKVYIMKTIILIFLVLLLCNSPLSAHHYITLGVGFSGAFFKSDELNRFKDTYNLVNSPYLAKYLRGIEGAVGLRWEVGYRYLRRLGTAVLVGLKNYTSKDAATYQNGETRNLELEMNSMFVEWELGYARSQLFINGVITLFFNRKLILESKYSDPTKKEPLSGVYSSDAAISTDLGIAVGIIRRQIILTTKITYPIFTGGKSNFLKDKRLDKIASGRDSFPSDYADYCFGKSYKGVRSNIDGLKVLVVVAFAIPINGGKSKSQITNSK